MIFKNIFARLKGNLPLGKRSGEFFFESEMPSESAAAVTWSMTVDKAFDKEQTHRKLVGHKSGREGVLVFRAVWSDLESVSRLWNRQG